MAYSSWYFLFYKHDFRNNPLYSETMNNNEFNLAPRWYFAYGSNMSERQMQDRGVVYTERIKGTLEGYRLAFNKKSSKNQGVGFANVMMQQGAGVKGILYLTNNQSIKRLDRAEGYPDHYEKLELPIHSEEHGQLQAIVYVAQPKHIGENLMVSPEYLDKVLSGRDLWGEVFACEVRIAAEGSAVSIGDLNKLKDGEEIPALLDGYKAMIGAEAFTFSDRLRIHLEEEHPVFNVGTFYIKDFYVEPAGCLHIRGHERCFLLQHRK